MSGALPIPTTLSATAAFQCRLPRYHLAHGIPLPFTHASLDRLLDAAMAVFKDSASPEPLRDVALHLIRSALEADAVSREELSPSPDQWSLIPTPSPEIKVPTPRKPPPRLDTPDSPPNPASSLEVDDAAPRFAMPVPTVRAHLIQPNLHRMQASIDHMALMLAEALDRISALSEVYDNRYATGYRSGVVDEREGIERRLRDIVYMMQGWWS